MIPFLAIGGTWSWRGSSRGQWYDAASPWSVMMRLQGFEHSHVVRGDGRPFVWDTSLDGNQFWRRWFGRAPSTTDWQAAGQNLHAYCVPPVAPERKIPPNQLHIICHSHAAQVVAFAAADGLQINTLVTVGSPVRADLFEVYHRARSRIGFWWHFYSDRTDRWQWLGEIGDGRVGIVRRHPCADQNVGLAQVGHSQILNDMRLFPQVWPGPLDLIRSRHGRGDVCLEEGV